MYSIALCDDDAAFVERFRLQLTRALDSRTIRLAATLRNSGYEHDIIFMSTTDDFAVASFDVAPLYYLLKPVDQEKLDTALDRFLDRNTAHTLRLNTARGVLLVRLADVAFFEIYAHEIVIHKTDRAKDSCVGTLKQLEALLPPQGFIRPHRSYLVNLDHVHKIVRYQIFLSSGEVVPVSKNLYQQVQQAFIDHADRRSRIP